MIIQAELKYKQSEYAGEPCIVDKVIELPNQRFRQFSRALQADYQTQNIYAPFAGKEVTLDQKPQEVKKSDTGR